MYIAIVADDVAARKQYERLFSRSNDALKSELGDLYVETFGSPNSLLVSTPMKYGLFFIDLATKDTILNLTTKLREMNAQGMVCLCTQETSAFSGEFPNLMFAAKDPTQKAVNDLIREAASYNQSINSIDKIEIRSEGMTYYLLPDDIIYIQAQNQYLTIYLEDRTILKATGELKRLFDNTLTDDCFCYFRKDVVINTHHVSQKERHSVTLDNGVKFNLPLFSSNPLL